MEACYMNSQIQYVLFCSIVGEIENLEISNTPKYSTNVWLGVKYFTLAFLDNLIAYIY